MKNKRDDSPNMDYFELRRRHEEYKNRERMATMEKADDEEQEFLSEQKPSADENISAARQSVEPSSKPVENTPSDIQEAVVFPETSVMEYDTVEENVISEAQVEADIPEAEEYDAPEDYASDEQYGDEEQYSNNPNPFDSFIRIFKNLKSRISRKNNSENDYYDDEYPEDDYPSEYSEEDIDQDDVPQDGYAKDDASVSHRGLLGWRKSSEAEVEPEEASADIADVVDLPEEDIPNSIPQSSDYSEEDYADEAYDDYNDYEDDEETPRKLSGFKKFLRLFIVPVSEEERTSSDQSKYEDDYTDEDYEDEDDSFNAHSVSSEDDYHININEARRDMEGSEIIEGGSEMSDLNKVNPELTKQLAADLENPGMSRRERRELAERLAAQKAAEEKAVAEKAESAEPVVSDLFDNQPLEADTVEDVSDGIVNIEESSSIDVSIVDEPTREFKPVSKLSFDEFMEAMEETSEDNDEYEEDEEDDEEYEKPRRHGLFSRRSRKAEKEADDEDEYDEDDDEEEDEDDEDAKPRRGLFGRLKSSKYDEDDDDEDDEDDEDDDFDEDDVKPGRKNASRKSRRNRYDDEDDYDDYDEDEDFDDYDDEDEDFDEDDDYDDYDEDDDDEDGSSAGRGILRFFISLLSIILVLAILFFAANIANLLGWTFMDNIIQKLPAGVVEVLFPSENTKNLISGDNDQNPVSADPSTVPTDILDNLETPATEADPVVETPSEDTPVSNIAGANSVG